MPRPKALDVERAQNADALIPSPRRSARLQRISPQPATPAIQSPGDTRPTHKRSRESIPPDDDNLTSKLSKSEMVIATPRAMLKPGASLKTVSKPPAPTVSDGSEEEEPHGSQQVASKGKEKMTPQEQAVEAVLHASPDNPYDILDVPDPSSVRTIQQAYRHLARLIHPDKTKLQGAEDAFKRLNWAGQMLNVPDAAFAANAFTEEANEELDDDGDTPMLDPDHHDPDPRPMPNAYIQTLYRQATPFVKRLFENPDDTEAKAELNRMNKLISADIRNNGLSSTKKPSVFIIQYQALASQAAMARLLVQALKSTPAEHFRIKYEDTKEQMNEANNLIEILVEENHYPTCWKVKFSLSENGKQLLMSYPEEDEPQPVVMGTETSNPPRTNATWRPGLTRQLEPILACKELFRTRKQGRKLRTPEVTGHLFIVQANGPDSQICEIRSGSEIGWRTTHAYTALPDRKMVGWSKSMSDNYEEIDGILKVAYSEDKPGLGLLVCVKVPGSDGEMDWITRTTLRDIWGIGDADATINEIFESEGEIPPRGRTRIEYKPRRAVDYKRQKEQDNVSSDEATSDESDSGVDYHRPSRYSTRATKRVTHRGHNQPSRRSAAAPSTSLTRQHYRQGRKSRMLKSSAAQDEDSEIAKLQSQLAQIRQELNRLHLRN
ncbi:hypothetical protein AJ79_10065 [Helicocarpus griseus UAMH5409]|uniref:J domain-containing protein n=1 Tax=Helicocarpus griseus UAMH5409 TaxID=1447875 RepID=A0A2B7WFL9_9EURO|nr:hypothetical protein AJ79_10065 [Helicocarpus griseus UAMH5409]